EVYQKCVYDATYIFLRYKCSGQNKRSLHEAANNMKYDSARFEQVKGICLVGRNLPKRVKREIDGFFHRLERHRTDLIRLAYFFQCPPALERNLGYSSCMATNSEVSAP